MGGRGAGDAAPPLLLLQIHNGKKKTEQSKVQNKPFKEKRITKKGMELSSVFKEINGL